MHDVSFLDIDLYLESDQEAPLLARNLSTALSVSRQDHDPNGHVMSFGSGWSGTGISPDECLSRYCDLIERMNQEARREWDSCRSRVFDMGFTSGDSPVKIHAILSAKTLQRLARLGCELVITFYPVRTARHPWQARVLA